MGTYYTWINATKRQLLENVFDNGYKLLESCGYDSPETNALLTLLATDWYGDFVAFVPDEGSCCKISDIEQGRWQQLRNLTGEFPLDYAEDWFDDIAGLFKCAEGKSGWVSTPKGPEGDYVEQGYSGPFNRDIIQYRYIVNESTHEWYDRLRNEEIMPGFDPFPVLMALCEDYLVAGDQPVEKCGIWMGDVIRPSHEPPGEGYTDITGYYRIY